jgi:glyoxylase-like metal-dependent hydrolase (beta-lactamase superfamily II)
MLGNPAANLSLGLGWPVFSPAADHMITSDTHWTWGEVDLRFIETPGHTRGSVCLWIGDALFSGDTVFAGTVGRTDLPGGDYSEILRSVRRLRDLLPNELQVFPGHGAATRWAPECQYNPFLNGDADEDA